MSDSNAHAPSVAGHQLTDLTALLGAVIWLAAVLVERAVALAPLVLSRMIALHSSLNAYGSMLGAMVDWRLSVPAR